METITSGSTTERVVRSSIVMVLSIGAAAWCFYDGFVKYPLENLKRAVADLSPPLEPAGAHINATIDAGTADSIGTDASLADLVDRFGDPPWRARNSQGDREARYFGPAGQLIVTLSAADRVREARYEPARYKSRIDLAFQKGMGAVVGVIALALIIHWIRVLAVKTTLCDAGVQTTGRPLVPFDAMTALHAETYARKGWVDIDYDHDGRSGVLRLDDYKIKAFPDIISEICRRRGWENPHEQWQESKKTARAGR